MNFKKTNIISRKYTHETVIDTFQRLHVFLFELALVLSRPGEDRDGGQVFHVYRQPLPNALINLEEIPDGEAGGGGTFRGAFTGGNDKGNTPMLPNRYNYAAQAGIITVTGSLVHSSFFSSFFPSKKLFPCEQQGALQSSPI